MTAFRSLWAAIAIAFIAAGCDSMKSPSEPQCEEVVTHIHKLEAEEKAKSAADNLKEARASRTGQWQGQALGAKAAAQAPDPEVVAQDVATCQAEWSLVDWKCRRDASTPAEVAACDG